MNEIQKSVVAAIGVALCGSFFYGGAMMRNHVDLGEPSLTGLDDSPVLRTWVASRDNNDVNIPAIDFYSSMVSVLKRNYVEPIKDDEKLASGSVRGMIGSLGDPKSLFMDQKEFKAYLNRQDGLYEGIGADLYLDLGGSTGPSARNGIQPPPQDAEEAVATMSRFPRVMVADVVPNGPADRAGVKPGDVVSGIDGHWVVDEALLDQFKVEQKLFNDKKITYQQIAPLQRELRKKTERALLPIRAEDRLLLGTSGTVSLEFKRAGKTRTVVITKAISKMPSFQVSGDSIRLPMTQAGVAGLKEAVKSRKAFTIDLRNDSDGSFDTMRSCLSLLAPSGHYGELVSQRPEKPQALTVTGGNAQAPKYKLLVDRTTRGPAEILALALSSHGRASLSGSEMGKDLAVSQTVALPDGTGYVLVTASYKPVGKDGVVALKESR